MRLRLKLKLRLELKNEDDLKNKDNLKNEDNLKNKDDLKTVYWRSTHGADHIPNCTSNTTFVVLVSKQTKSPNILGKKDIPYKLWQFKSLDLF